MTIWLIYVFLVFELGTRLFFLKTGDNIEEYRNLSFDWPKIFVKDPHTGSRMRPHAKGSAMVSDFLITYETNNLGLREKEISNEKDHYRVLFLGDSMTFGVGIPIGKRFSDIVGDAYPDIETINAGVPGYGIHQMASWYEHYGKNIKADVVLCDIIESDIDRAVRDHLDEKNKHIMPRETLFEKSYDNILSNNFLKHSLNIFSGFTKRLDHYLKASYFYSYFRVKFKILSVTYLMKERDERTWRKAHEERRLSINKDIKAEYRKDIARKIFFDLQKTSFQRGAKLAVVNIDVIQMDWLSELLKELDIPYIDVSPYLVNETTIRFKIDPHYNSYGNQLVGNVLIEKLQNLIAKK